MKSGSWKLLVLFALAVALGAARADEAWNRPHPWRLDCRFIGTDRECEAGADLCQLDHGDRAGCADVMQVTCNGQKKFEGVASHAEIRSLEALSGGGARLLYEAQDTDLSAFVTTAWLDSDAGELEGFCHVTELGAKGQAPGPALGPALW